MHTTTALSRGNPLNPMATGFIFKLGEIIAFDFESYLKISRVCWTFPNDAVLSTLTGEETQICVRKIADKKLTISPAFGGAYFYDSFHSVSPVVYQNLV